MGRRERLAPASWCRTNPLKSPCEMDTHPAYEDNASCGVENRFLNSGGATVIDGDPS
jgi:hypothetical protein